MKKTIKKRAFVSAIAMLIVSAIVLTSSTFAWFSMSKKAEISAMDLTVSSASGIQISANAKAWTSSLDSAEFFNPAGTTRYSAYDGNRNLNPENLIPVSSSLRAFNVQGPGFPNFFQINLDENGKATTTTLTQQPENARYEGLMAFDLFFKLEERTVVKFGATEITTAEGSEDVLSTMRIAYINEGNLPATATQAEAIALAGGASGTTTLYEYDAYSRSAGALDQGNTYGAKTTQGIMGTGATNRNVNGDSILASGGGVEMLNCTLKQGQPLNADGTKNNQNTSDFTFTLQAGISKVRIYIWVEGNDIDCRNTVAGSELTVNLKFDID